MVEPIMYLAIGFLVSMLLGLMIVPLVHNRAVRLTTKRMEAATPLSMAEIQADKDQLRAEFAMSARRLEMSVDQLKNKTTSQLAELGKKSDAINRMKIELGEKNATIFSLEAREKAVKEQLRATEEEFAAKTESLRDAALALKDKQSELAKLSTELSDRSTMAETRQVELVAVRAQIVELQSRVGDAENEFAVTQARLEQQRGESGMRRAHKTAARHQRNPAAGRKLLGARAHGKRAAARTHQRYRRRSGKARDAARGSEFADRGHAGGGTGAISQSGAPCQRRRGQWQRCPRGRRHPRRAHQGAAIPRLPRQPAAADVILLSLLRLRD